MSEPVVEIRQLTKKYGKFVAVQGLDLTVPRGSTFGLLGPNGAGKSTTFGVLCGWLKPTSGSAMVLGVPVNKLYTLRGRVSALPQDAHFPHEVSVVSQIEHLARLSGFSTAAAKEEALRVLSVVDLAQIGKKTGAELSHGMHKRVGIATCLIGKPEVIFLDEPTAGLDPVHAHELRQLIASLNGLCTIVISSHNLTEIQELCTHGAILDHGKLVKSGAIEEFTRSENEIEIEVAANAICDLTELNRVFGSGSSTMSDKASVRVRFGKSHSAPEAIRAALEILFSQNVPVLGVSRGTSLETAFIEMTSKQPKPN